MPAKVIDGKKIAGKIYKKLEKDIFGLNEQRIEPGLAIVQVGNDPASEVYVGKKVDKAKELGLFAKRVPMTISVSFEQVAEAIKKLNEDNTIHGMIVQMPLPPQLDPVKVMELINPEKDVDGFSSVNQGRLFAGKPYFIPATPKGIMEIIKSIGVKVSGKNAVVVGRSNIVGKPIAALLLQEDATVTICHSKTKNLAGITAKADILISAVGKPKLIKGNMVKKGAIVIDVGTTKKDGKLVGDVDFENVKKKAAWITPVPGGVGPMTIVSLMQNTITAAKRKHGLK
jgi:methylenetetrahydrofolate dehydrogenase (NADP+)/methenyltetrahydrofolate cyclohydrolase